MARFDVPSPSPPRPSASPGSGSSDPPHNPRTNPSAKSANHAPGTQGLPNSSTEPHELVRHKAVDAMLQRRSVRHDLTIVLDHPNIIRLLCSIVVNKRTIYTIWENCNGGSLESLMADHPILPESLIWHTALSLFNALVWLKHGPIAYGQGSTLHNWLPIMHNAINPSNIFYTFPTEPDPDKKYGDCKLGNFTRCVVLEDPNEYMDSFDLRDADIEGEYTRFSAPELSNHSPANDTYGLLSDLWSLGAVLVAMMTGKTVWDHVMSQAVSDKMRSRRKENWKGAWPPDRYERLHELIKTDRLWKTLPERYSEELRFLAQFMLDVDPRGRVPFDRAMEYAEHAYMRRRRLASDRSEYCLEI